MVNTLLPTTVVGSYPQPSWLIAAILAAAVIALSGCAIALPTVDPVSDRHLRGHYVLAHEDGYPIALPALSGDGPATQERRVTRAELSPPQDREDLDARVVAGIDRHAKRLWSAAGADPSATGPVLRLFVSQDCARARTDYYPIFINWNSGLPDSIVDDLFFIRFGQRRPEYALFTWPFVLAGRLVESIFSAPAAWLASSRTYWEGEPKAGEITESTALLPVRALTIPVVKAFGTSAWQIMRRRADLVAADRLEPARGPEGAPPLRRRGAARTLFEVLASRIERCGGGACWKVDGQTGTGGPVEVTLVEHSMGAIVLNRLLVTPRPLPVKRIVYLAPAASLEEIEGQVRPYLAHPPDTGAGQPEFWTFTLTRHDEALERDWKTAILPRGTLLVWIDNFFEPVSEPGDNRAGRYRSHLDYYGRDAEAPAVAALNVCHWTDDAQRRPTAHAAIDDLPFLEGALFRVAPHAFRAPAEIPPIEVACRVE